MVTILFHPVDIGWLQVAKEVGHEGDDLVDGFYGHVDTRGHDQVGQRHLGIVPAGDENSNHSQQNLIRTNARFIILLETQ